MMHKFSLYICQTSIKSLKSEIVVPLPSP